MKRRRIMRFRTREDVAAEKVRRADRRERENRMSIAMAEAKRLNRIYANMDHWDDLIKDIRFIEAPKPTVVDSSTWTGRS